jgi:hypothetical protein
VRDCADDVHPIREGPIHFTGIHFGNLSVDGDHVFAAKNV